jgi:hypothetical protein
MINQEVNQEVWDRASQLIRDEDLSYSAAWRRAYDEWLFKSFLARHAAESMAAPAPSPKGLKPLPSPLWGITGGGQPSSSSLREERVPLQSLVDALASKEDPHALAAYLSVQAALAYREEPKIRIEVEKEEGKHYCPFEKWTTFAFGYTRAQHAFLAFRGTHRAYDWLIDFNFIPWGWPLRHLGFIRAWARIRKKVIQWVKELPEDSRQLVLTGHSLGAALAVLAAFDLAKRKLIPVRRVVTFGQPRVGLFHFSDCYEMQRCGPQEAETLHAISRRYTHETDVVSRLPPPLLYCHVGDPWLLDSLGNRTQGRPKGRLARLEEAYYDAKFKLATLPQKIEAQKQEKERLQHQLISRNWNAAWDEALKPRTVQPPAPPVRVEVVSGTPRVVQPPVPPVIVEMAPGLPSMPAERPERPVIQHIGNRWQTLAAHIPGIIGAIGQAPVLALWTIGVLIVALISWSLKRDVEAHFRAQYLEAFRKAYPNLVLPGHLKFGHDAKKSFPALPT